METNEPLREIIRVLLQIKRPSYKDLHRTKTQIAQKYKLQKIPSNSEIISQLEIEEKHKLLPILRRKNVRTISGVTVVAVMTKPYPCPQPEPCAYCPGGPTQGVPQSYTGFEPAAMRGLQNSFDPHKQVTQRIQQIEAIGHNVDKIELIIMGGTFPATPLYYQTWFIQRCLDAITNKKSSNLDEAKRNAETSIVRNVGITVETRPDWAKETHADKMLEMGVTRVEMGVQNPSDRIYQQVGREHTVQDVIDSTRILKDAGLKIVYHLMPGLPGSNIQNDYETFKDVFENPSYKPDMIKIYPCLVLKGTKAFEWFQQGHYTPYNTEEAANLIARVKAVVPPWIRIMRVQRDIPARLIMAGVKKSHLREIVQQQMTSHGTKCRCIRCREIGHKTPNANNRKRQDRISILSTRYEASEGNEIFISAEDTENDALIGYLRLRIPSEKAHRQEIKANPCSIVRELHVYGPLVPVGKHNVNAWQHKGYGSVLLAEAERKTREDHGLKRILVISALGTKQYYEKFGYTQCGVYMAKNLED